MPTEHMVKRFDQELEKLDAAIVEMGGLAEMQIARALKAVRERDSSLAEQVIREDARIDGLERAVQAQVVQMLALRQPMAVDLRTIVSAIKLSIALERIADYAKNTAKRAIVLSQATVPPRAVSGIDRLGRLVQGALKDVLDAFARRDAEKAHEVWLKDEEIDDAYNGLFRELVTYMIEDPRNITACTHLMFMAKNIERVGDHATNIAELVQFRKSGGDFEDQARPKGGGEIYRPAGGE